MPTFENAHCGQESNAGAKAGAADLELAGQFTLRRQAVAGMNLAAADEEANMLDDLHGELAVASGFVV
jgi:hypothetical protein